jgi:hypothetical protein
MSYEPTQPMTPPSTSSTVPVGGDQDTKTEGDRGRDDAVREDAPQGGWGQGSPSDGGVSQATVPRAVLSHDNVAAPRGDAAPPVDAPQADIAEIADPQDIAADTDPQDATPQAVAKPAATPQDAAAEVSAPQDATAKAGQGRDDEPTGDWASEYSAAWRQVNASDSDRNQGNDPQGDWAQGTRPQGDWNRGSDPQGYGPGGYGPREDWNQGDWNRGNAPQGGYGPQDYGPERYGPQDYGPEDAPPTRPRRRRRPVRRSVISLFVLLVIAIVLVIGNFVGQAIAENDMANQFTANGFPVKPSVDIEGFPFLTQVAAKDFKKVVISASNIPAGPVTISSLNATITGMHLNSSWNGATIDHVTATAFVSLSSLTDGISSELGDAASLTAVPDGANKLKVTGTVLGLSASGVVEIKQTGPQQITVELPTTGGLVGTLLGSAASFTITLPAGVPPSLRITGLTINGQGLTLSAAATDATFSQ